MGYIGGGAVLLVIGLLLQALGRGALDTIGWVAAVVGAVLLVVGVVLAIVGRGSRTL